MTLPSVPLQDFSTELLVRVGRKLQTGMFGTDRIHEARSEICDKGMLLLTWKELKESSNGMQQNIRAAIVRFAPARKSAQIISKQ